MRCYLVRHAQTVWNGENRLQGHSDLELSTAGLEQARRVAAFFAARRASGEALRALYSSSLKRSVQTAQAIAHATGLAPLLEPALAEMHLGDWEGLTPEEIDAKFEGAYQRWYRHPSQVVIPGSEPLEGFKRRVQEAFEGIRTTANGREGAVVIVTHGGVIASLLAGWLKADYEDVLRRVVLSNAGVSAVECHAIPPPATSAGSGSSALQADVASGDVVGGGTMPPYILWLNATRHLTEV